MEIIITNLFIKFFTNEVIANRYLKRKNEQTKRLKELYQKRDGHKRESKIDLIIWRLGSFKDIFELKEIKTTWK